MNGKVWMRPLSSGSSGNSVLVSAGDAKIMVDCGITGKAAAARLEEAGLDARSVDAIIVTHEHIDHIKGIGVMCRKFRIPIYATMGTWQAMIGSIGKIDTSLIHYIAADVPFKIKNAEIVPFATSHDAAESIGMVFSCGGQCCALATDLGTVDRHICDLLLKCGILVIEANHDERMLINGSYPQILKQRILSDRGHLSNRMCGAFCARLAREGAVRQIMLAHLSNDNNTPEAAYSAVAASLGAAGFDVGTDIKLYVAKRSDISEMMVHDD